ncbi:MAG: DNA translocase FtsK 4TM domain-containing protein [Chloroflexota bacterium]|nr:DNA translocase FtsK 4TM domain-containing protein [Chloroflexota bacterium]
MANDSHQTENKRKGSGQPGLFDESPSWQDEAPTGFRRFLRFGWDLLGVLLFAGAAILLLGSVGITQGALISPLTAFLARWLGLGRFLLVAAMIYIGLRVIRWRKHPPETIALGRILSLEFAAFMLMGLLSLISGSSIAEAELGNDLGGLVGWGVSEIFSAAIGPTLAFVLLLILFSFSIISAFNLLTKLEKAVQRRLGTAAKAAKSASNTMEMPKPVMVSELDDEPEARTEMPKKQVYLPPEFRKSFDTPDIAENTSETAPERSPDLPPLDLLLKGETYKPDKRTINMTAGLIEKTLDEFGIPARVVGFRTGPTVTQFAVEPGYIDKSDDERQKIRVAQISSLQRDLALALSAERLRIEAPVPGKSYVGIEIPNPNAAKVQLRPLIESETFYRVNSPLALALGRDVSGRSVVSDLTTMPHLLIAGTTGSGKSVCITAITTCLVMNNSPADLKLAMIDPKRVELMRFNGLPHLMGSVETEIERILGVLRWATSEMDYRYKLLEKARARNIDSYNHKMARQGKKTLPKIVILIDELADLMMTAPDQTEHALVRLAQKARAIGIHLVVATQRPSTDVVTGLIKANFPTRISFTVATSIDSRVILDTGGAETLLGRGDMLFLHPEIGLPMRSQGVIVSDKELSRVIRWWKKEEDKDESAGQARYDDSESPPWEEKVGLEDDENEDEALITEAIELIREAGHASASFLQRQLRVGYPRAARLVDELEERGILGPSQGGGRERDILIDIDGDDEDDE